VDLVPLKGPGFAVEGFSRDGFAGVHGHGGDNGVYGLSEAIHGSGVFGRNDAGNGVAGHSQNGVGVKGTGGRLAGLFEGNIEVTGDIRLTGQDIAELFQVVGPSEAPPGTVMVLTGSDQVQVCDRAYDRRVVGVISSAGRYRPGVVLGHSDAACGHRALAMLGKVVCKVDASAGAVEIGDLLTTSSTIGYAMKAVDAGRAFGAVLGKAMAPLAHGTGLLPILVALQ
jgi:hypothetical protein